MTQLAALGADRASGRWADLAFWVGWAALGGMRRSLAFVIWPRKFSKPPVNHPAESAAAMVQADTTHLTSLVRQLAPTVRHLWSVGTDCSSFVGIGADGETVLQGQSAFT